MDQKIKKYIGPVVQILGGGVLIFAALLQRAYLFQSLLFLLGGLTLMIIGVVNVVKK